MDATAMVLDLRNSTALHRLMKKKKQRMLIVRMMIGIHEEILNYLYEHSDVEEADFAFNDTGDGYIIVFTNESHAFSCVLCAVHLRGFLRKHIDTFNKKLKIDRSNLRYSFGIGVHTAYARLIMMDYKTANNKIFSKKFILGNAANTSARVESMTKNFVDVDLLITGNTRLKCHQQAESEFKKLFKKNGSHMNPIGEVRHIVKDHKADGHRLYSISDEFNIDYTERKETKK
jgi:class 3 adenylate cyclase